MTTTRTEADVRTEPHPIGWLFSAARLAVRRSVSTEHTPNPFEAPRETRDVSSEESA